MLAACLKGYQEVIRNSLAGGKRIFIRGVVGQHGPPRKINMGFAKVKFLFAKNGRSGTKEF